VEEKVEEQEPYDSDDGQCPHIGRNFHAVVPFDATTAVAGATATSALRHRYWYLDYR
jgi:hypothetical protein